MFEFNVRSGLLLESLFKTNQLQKWFLAKTGTHKPAKPKDFTETPQLRKFLSVKISSMKVENFAKFWIFLKKLT